MLLNSCFDVVKKGGLLLILLLQSTIFQANAADADGNEAGINGDANENAVAAENDATDENDESGERAFSFPRWPDSNRPVFRERIPMAPPGPYMSSALSDFSFDDSPFGQRMDRSRDEMDRARDERDRMRREEDMDRMRDFNDRSIEMSMERFNPDIPWPSNNEKAPTRWMPEDGYRYVEEEAQPSQRSYQSGPYNAQPGYYYGYQAPPVMTRPVADYRMGGTGVNRPAR